MLAVDSRVSDELAAAALLHDIGHLLAPRPHRVDSDSDDVHQYLAVPFLRGMLPDAVLEPIRLHVDAKRYLCRTEEGYRDRLSAASRHSLELQGGAFDAQGAEHFIARPFARDAVRLRRWDDLAKEPGRATPPLREFERLLERVALRPSPFLAMASTHL
jgi:predicted HD phosphohydrolase